MFWYCSLAFTFSAITVKCVFHGLITKGFGLTGADCQGFSVRCGALHLTSYLLRLASLASIFLVKSEGHPRPFTRSFYLSRGREKFLSWGRKFFIFIDNAKVQIIQMQNNSFSRLFFIKCNFVLSNFKIPPARCYAVTQLHSFIYPQRSFIFQWTFILYYYI